MKKSYILLVSCILLPCNAYLSPGLVVISSKSTRTVSHRFGWALKETVSSPAWFSVDQEQDLRQQFEEILPDGSQMSFEGFLKFEDVAALLEDGDLQMAEAEVAWLDVLGGVDPSEKTADVEEFLKAYWKIESLFEPEEGKAQAESSTDEAQATADESEDVFQISDAEEVKSGGLGGEKLDEKVIASVFQQLTESEDTLSFEKALQWKDIVDMISDEDSSEEELQGLWIENVGNKEANLRAFTRFVRAVENLFDWNEGDDDEAEVEAEPELSVEEELQVETEIEAVKEEEPEAEAETGTEAKDETPPEADIEEVEEDGEGQSEDEEHPEDTEDEEENGDDGRDSELVTTFSALAGEDGLIGKEELLQWAELAEMLSVGDVAMTEVDMMWSNTLLAHPQRKGEEASEKVDVQGFIHFANQVADLFDLEDVDDEFPEEDVEADLEEMLRTPAEATFKIGQDPRSDEADQVPADPQEPEEGEEVDTAALKDELFQLLAPLAAECGMNTPPAEQKEISEVAKALLGSPSNLVQAAGLTEPGEVDVAVQTILGPALEGKWELKYTSSWTMEYNQGFSGLAKTIPGASFAGVQQELMNFSGIQDASYLETLLIRDKPLEVQVSATWELQESKSVMTGDKIFSLVVSPEEIRYSFVKYRADRWKTMRAWNLLDLVYLDEDTRIMKVQTSDTIFIYKRC